MPDLVSPHEMVSLENAFDFASERTARDCQRNLSAPRADPFVDAIEKNDAARYQFRVALCLLSEHRFDAGIAERQPALPGQRAQDARIVEAEIVVVVLPRAEIDAASAEHLLERAQVQFLGVGDDAVEVEDDRLKHYFRGAFSPARMATGNRFSFGGTGQS